MNYVRHDPYFKDWLEFASLESITVLRRYSRSYVVNLLAMNDRYIRYEEMVIFYATIGKLALREK